MSYEEGRWSIGETHNLLGNKLLVDETGVVDPYTTDELASGQHLSLGSTHWKPSPRRQAAPWPEREQWRPRERRR